MLLRILTLLLSLLILPDLYIYVVCVRRPAGAARTAVRCLLWFLPSIILLALGAFIILSGDMKPAHQHWVSVFMIVFLTLCVPKALFALIDIVGRPFRGRMLRRIIRIVAMSVSLCSLGILITGSLVGRDLYVIRRHTFYFDDLPARFDGYRIAQFSDLHVGTGGGNAETREVVDLINAQGCDAIAFTGDLVNHHPDELIPHADALARLSAPDGVYAVMGNHDYSIYQHVSPEERQAQVVELRRRIRSFGWTLLLNDHKTLRRGKDSLIIAGVENDGTPPFPSLGDLPKTMRGLRRSCFTVLLSHDPTLWRRKILPQTHIQLTLSGHTHAGQFMVFGWSPVAHVYKEWIGSHQRGGQILHISAGIGNVMLPFRFGAWPEVNIITLRKGKPNPAK